MSWGLQVFDAGGRVMFSSPTHVSLYPYYSSTSASAIPAPSTGSGAGVACASGSLSLTVAFGDYGWATSITAQMPGACINGAFNTATKSVISAYGKGWRGAELALPAITVAPTNSAVVLSSSSTSTSTGYGMEVRNATGDYVVDGKTLPQYFMRWADGNYLKTSTVYNAPAGSAGITTVFSTAAASVLPLPYPVYTPPLVWVKSSSEAYVAFDGYVKDSYGRYTGVSVVVPPSGGSSYASGSASASITYAVSTNDLPSDLSGHGMVVWDPSGKAVFSSNSKPLSPLIRQMTSPYLSTTYPGWDNEYSVSRTVYYGDNYISKTPTEAVCINSFSSVSGVAVWSSGFKRVGGGAPAPVIEFYEGLSINQYGKFVQVGVDKVTVAARYRSGTRLGGQFLGLAHSVVDGHIGINGGKFDVMLADVSHL